MSGTFNYKFLIGIYTEIYRCKKTILKMRNKNQMLIDASEINRLYFLHKKILGELDFFFLYDALYYKLNKHLIFEIGKFI